MGVPVAWYFIDTETYQIYSRKNYKDISTEKIINNCLKQKNKKNEILALYMSEHCSKLMYYETTRIADRKIQYVNNEYCKEDNLSN